MPGKCSFCAWIVANSFNFIIIWIPMQCEFHTFHWKLGQFSIIFTIIGICAGFSMHFFTRPEERTNSRQHWIESVDSWKISFGKCNHTKSADYSDCMIRLLHWCLSVQTIWIIEMCAAMAISDVCSQNHTNWTTKVLRPPNKGMNRSQK